MNNWRTSTWQAEEWGRKSDPLSSKTPASEEISGSAYPNDRPGKILLRGTFFGNFGPFSVLGFSKPMILIGKPGGKCTGKSAVFRDGFGPQRGS